MLVKKCTRRTPRLAVAERNPTVVWCAFFPGEKVPYFFCYLHYKMEEPSGDTTLSASQ